MRKNEKVTGKIRLMSRTIKVRGKVCRKQITNFRRDSRARDFVHIAVPQLLIRERDINVSRALCDTELITTAYGLPPYVCAVAIMCVQFLSNFRENTNGFFEKRTEIYDGSDMPGRSVHQTHTLYACRIRHSDMQAQCSTRRMIGHARLMWGQQSLKEPRLLYRNSSNPKLSPPKNH